MESSKKIQKGQIEDYTPDIVASQLTAITNQLGPLIDPDKLLVEGEVVRVGNVVSIAEGEFEWRSLQFDYTNIDYSTTITPAAEGSKRIDIIYTDNDTASFIKLEGEESLDIAIKPGNPPNTFIVAIINIFGENFDVEIPIPVVDNPPQYLELRIISKGNPGGVPNTSNELEVEDVVQGMKESGYIWSAAVYNGGDPNDRNNYTEILGGQYK